jgi:S-adenosylmethionine decarboxylase proenzyme
MLHLIGHLSGSTINFVSELENRMDKVAERCKFSVVNRAFHQFEPVGVTGVLVLAESHFSAHTYPEDQKIYFDVFCCSPHFEPEVCARVIEEEFGGALEWSVVQRR